MNLDKALPKLIVAFAASTLFACSGGDTLTPTDTGTNGNPDGGTIVPPDGGPGGLDAGDNVPTITASQKGNLRFKRNIRLANDIALGLELQPNQVCQELGLYDCTSFVHTVTLGGTGSAAYLQGLYRPTEQTSVSTPLAVERVVLHACEARAATDLSDAAGAVVFKDLAVDGDGKIGNSDAISNVVNELYRRAVQRNATDEEKAHLTQLYQDFEADGEGDAAKAWAVLSCSMVFSSMEALFY